MIYSVITVIVNKLMIIEYDRPLEWALGSPASRAVYLSYIQSKAFDDRFNEVFSKMSEPLPEIWAIDVAMKPYFGCHSLKQFIREKPVRFGYKFWSL